MTNATTYETVTDAFNALINSGVIEWFDVDEYDLNEVAEWMWRNEATPDQAAEHYGVE